jgi:hypothetical protein
VLLGRGDHRLEQPAVGLLDVGLALQLEARVAQPQGEGVANPLELAGREHARAAGGAHSPLEAAAREGRGEGLAEGALEPRDLTP